MKVRLERLISSLAEGLIEREIPSRLIILSALTGEHSLLVGPPGTAKSILARKLHELFAGGEYFERLLTRFSVPEELFGPLSIKALENDQYHRQTEHYLPSASIAFIDEIFKANSAILNSLLTILNEGEFDNGAQRQKVPLVSVVAASNELPDDSELEALYDRFLIRYQVQPVSELQFKELLLLPSEAAPGTLHEQDKLTTADIEHIQQQSKHIVLPDEVIQLLSVMRDYLKKNNHYISDRRWRNVVKLLKVSAYTNGQKQVSIWDCWLVQHCLWSLPEQRAGLVSCYEMHLGIGSGFYPERLEKLISTWEQSLNEDQNSEVQSVNKLGHRLYFDINDQLTTDADFTERLYRDAMPLYLSPRGQEEDRSNDNRGYTHQELRDKFFDSHYKQTHIDGSWQHIDEYVRLTENHLLVKHKHRASMEPLKHAHDYIQSKTQELSYIHTGLIEQTDILASLLGSVKEEISEHLWIDSSFQQIAVKNLKQSQLQVSTLCQRIDTVMAGYRQLPVR
ncbi:MAG: AAA family ATPase [Pseudomonadales bacterium]|nr:AAA family ATPase [Pseudomonadales bacterium]